VTQPADSPLATNGRVLEALQLVADAALAHLSDDELLNELLLRITEILHTDTAAILLLDERGELLHARAARGIEEEVERGVKIPVGKGFAGRIAAERRAITIEDVDHADILNPILREKGIRSLLGVPLLVEGRVLGVLHVGSLVPRIFTPDDRDLLQLAADRAALAIQQAFVHQQRRLAETMQRRLLPTNLQGLPGLELATRYLPASGESLGGDWYDVFPIGGGRIVVAAGDVVGHGIEAAGAMAQLRTALRAYAVDGHPPGAVVDRVNRLNCELGPSSMTTLAYAVIDPEMERLELVNAGHPPPVVVNPEGAATYLAQQGSIPLGASELARYRGETHPFPSGSAIVLYTDGLIERRGESIEAGLERLQALSAGAGDLESLCALLVDELMEETRADDVAIIAARFPPPPERLAETWPAERAALAGIRLVLRRWLRAQGASDDELYDIVVACQEACANAVEHAYPPGRRTFELEASCDDGRVRIAVRDAGTWRPPRGSDRGRGLVLMRGLMDSVDVANSEAGTVVVLERLLQRSST